MMRVKLEKWNNEKLVTAQQGRRECCKMLYKSLPAWEAGIKHGNYNGEDVTERS
jgi:hypothetical protein